MSVKLVFFTAFICLYSCREKDETTKPFYRAITQSVFAPAVIKSRDQYQVYANAQGIISKTFVTEGDSVSRGQALFVIHNAVAALNTKGSALSLSFNELQNNREKLSTLFNSLDIAREKKSNDSILYLRQMNLWNKGIGTKNELEQRELAARSSAANLDNQLLQYQQLKKQLAYTESQARNNLDVAQSQQRELEIKSGVNGRVFSILKKQGEMVTAQTPLAIIGSDNNLYLELQVDENDIARITEGQQVFISMDSYPGQIFEARTSRIYPIMNERSRSFIVEAILTKRPPKLYPNLTAEANILVLHKEKALLVPRNFLVDDRYVLLKDKKKVPVEIGIKDYQYAEIIRGLSANDEIVKPR